MRRLVTLVVGLMPPSSLKNALLRALGHSVHPTARIAPMLILGATRLEVAEGVRLGTLSCLRDVCPARFERNAFLGQLNWVSAAPFLVAASGDPRAGTLLVGEEAAIMSRHYLDVSGGVEIGAYTVIAGVRSTFITHGVEMDTGLVETAPIIVGRRVMAGSSINLVLGAVVPDRAVIAMGSTVVRGLTEEQALYGGTPAKLLRHLPELPFMTRTQGPIDPKVTREVVQGTTGPPGAA